MNKRNIKKLKKQIQGYEQDKIYIMEKVRYNVDILKFIDKQLLKDITFMTIIISAANGMALKYASRELKDNKEIVINAIRKSDGFAFKYASRRLRADEDVVVEAIKRWRGPLKYASKDLKNKYNKKIDDYYKKYGHNNW